MISVVNGYICTSSCEVAVAKHGKDPTAGSSPGVSGDNDKTSAFAAQPAREGTLDDLASSKPGTPVNSAWQPRLDRLV